jgi:glycosyltransferase involved in cell wall biosynthesis
VRVAIFTDNDFGKVNGVTTTLKAVLHHAPRQIQVKVYTADDRGVDDPQYLALRSPGIPIPYYREMKVHVPRTGEYIRRARADRIDVIHMTTPGPVGLAAMRVARVLDIPMVGTFHTDLAAYTTLLSGSPRLGRLMGRFLRWPYGRCSRILAPSEDTRRLLIRGRSDPERIGIWVRGVDDAAFSPVHRSESLRQAWGVSDARPAVLYVGRVSREKGLALLPELGPRLLARGAAHRFVVVGQGPMDAELRQALPDAVFTGSLDRSDVAVAFASADVFVFPSRTDTAGNVVLEAQASGLPVLVSNAGGPRENMLSGRSGYVVSGTSGDSWAQAVAPLLTDAGRRRQLGAGAREYALTRTWPMALEPLYRTYYEILLERSDSTACLDHLNAF